MELNKTRCKSCGHLNRWYGYKWVNTESRRAHNRTNNTTCPKCKSTDVENVEDAETMAPYRAFVEAVFGGPAPEKKTFTVCKREVWTQLVEVEATSKEEALKAVSRGEGTDCDNTLEYSHDMSIEYWTVDDE
jgi:hypothetical protein